MRVSKGVSLKPSAFRTVRVPSVKGGGRSRSALQTTCKVPPGTTVVRGKCFVAKDNIDTDQIIPAEFLTLVPSKPAEYEQLGSYAMYGLPEALYPTRFVKDGTMKTDYKVIIAGENFGCGSSREHAPVALGAAGSMAVVAQSYARIFFRNCMATGELFPVETEERLCDQFETGTEVELDLSNDTLTNVETGKVYKMQDLGEAKPVIEAGGIFAFAREQGLISKS
ncbi:hypothetical protein BSKO_11421 [Bryopsis sp. KO-2023]|nr:hypothetical protein BSKO_11421 [Bryopsis sp. KO-2023]